MRKKPELTDLNCYLKVSHCSTELADVVETSAKSNVRPIARVEVCQNILGHLQQLVCIIVHVCLEADTLDARLKLCAVQLGKAHDAFNVCHTPACITSSHYSAPTPLKTHNFPTIEFVHFLFLILGPGFSNVCDTCLHIAWNCCFICQFTSNIYYPDVLNRY